MKNKILLVGALYSGNLGDDVIFEVVNDACAATTKMDPIKFSISGRQQKQANKANKANRSSLKKLLKALIANTAIYKKYVEKKRCVQLKEALNRIELSTVSKIVFDGGQLFFDVFVPLINIIVSEAEKNNITVLFNACGIGPLSEKNKKLLKHILSKECVALITLRERVELFYHCIGNLGNKTVFQVMDPALECSNIYPASEKKNVIGIGLINPVILKKHGATLDYDSYLKVIQYIIEACDLRGINYEFFCNGDLSDFEFIKKVCHQIGVRSSCIADRPLTVEQLIKTISGYEKIISFRLHSHIIAASYGIPSFGLLWDSKVEEFFIATDRPDAYIKVGTSMDYRIFKDKINAFLGSAYYINLKKYPNACDVLCKFLDKNKE